MDYTQNIVDILEILIRIGVIVVVTFIIPYIKQKTKGTEYEKFSDYVVDVVLAMEQTMTKEQATEKKERAVQLVKEFLKNSSLKITDDQVDTLIEAAVKTLKDQTKIEE